MLLRQMQALKCTSPRSLVIANQSLRGRATLANSFCFRRLFGDSKKDHRVLDGKKESKKILAHLKTETEDLFRQTGRRPCLAILTVDPSKDTQMYIKVKREACEHVGFSCIIKEYNKNITQRELEREAVHLCERSDIHGVIAQLPVPKHIDSHRLIEALMPEKDVDGLHPANLAKLFLGRPTRIPAAPLGILQLLRAVPEKLDGKFCVVVGRGNLVAKPTAALLMANGYGNMSVAIVDGKASNLKSLAHQADVLVVASNQCEFITPEMVKDGAVVIDTGIHYIEDESSKSGVRMKGNVHRAALKHASYYTPVPGGVGPMTVACLLQNTLQAAQEQLRAGAATHVPTMKVS